MGVTLTARDLVVELRTGTGENKTLLDHVSLSARPGEMVAIMGPSGSGKTTMLNVLAARRDRSFTVNGDIRFNGSADEINHIPEFATYVMQHDHFLEFLTVLETVTFAARLRLGRRSKREQQERINFVIEELGLQSCKHVLVGGADNKSLSGGQLKRLSVAVSILARPQLIFLDEPTSSLDASMAYDVIKTLRGMSEGHRHTIICTIHQPRSQVFTLFDSLLLLRLGKVVYRGNPNEATDWFASLGHTCPPEFNPPDFFLDLLTESSGIDVKPTGGLDRKESVVRVAISGEAADKLAISFADSDFNKAQLNEIDELAKEGGDIERCDATEFKGIYWFVRAVAILAHRDVKNKLRNPQSLFAGIGQSLFMAIVLGTIFYKQKWPQTDLPPSADDPCDSQALRNMAGALAQLITVLAFSAFDCAIDVIKERALINREVQGGLYGRPARFFSNMMAGAVFHYWGVLIVMLTLYWMMGLRATAASWFTTLIACFILQFAAVSLAKMCGFLAGSIPVAMALLPLFGVNLFIVSGFQISDDSIPGWLVWLKAISYFRYAFQSVTREQFQENDYLDTCMGFQTPHSVWLNIFYTFLSALGFRFVGFVAQLTMHKTVGLTV